MYRFSRKNLKTKGDTNLRKSVGWRTFKVLAFWSEGKWQAQFLKLVPSLSNTTSTTVISTNQRPAFPEASIIMLPLPPGLKCTAVAAGQLIN